MTVKKMTAAKLKTVAMTETKFLPSFRRVSTRPVGSTILLRCGWVVVVLIGVRKFVRMAKDDLPFTVLKPIGVGTTKGPAPGTRP